MSAKKQEKDSEKNSFDITKEKIIQQIIVDEMKNSYLTYSMSVIVGRALPDVRDGLKPVHRRILFAMNEMGMTHNKPFKKSARVVGEVLGKYHPHGDQAVYDSIVRMVQDFSLRYPLIKGQGNFGSIDGDSAAAMRYTEVKLAKISDEILSDIDKETVSFVPNFDESLEEPTVLPAKLPNLLINGSSGIAVGMATNIPPHNITEICNTIIAVLDDPNVEIGHLMNILKGPDFPTGGIISGTSGIFEAYSTGRGKILIRAKFHREEKGGRKKIIITEIPYQVNKSMLIEEIADCVKEKKIDGISDLRDESDRDGMRIVVELKKDANPEVVENQLMKNTRLKITFGIILLTLVNNQPKVLGVKEIIEEYLKHRIDIITKRTIYELKKAEEKAHILEGLTIALNNIDEIIQKIKRSKDTEIAKNVLIADYSLSETQAKAILDMKLQRLSSLEQEKIKEDYHLTLNDIEECKSILASQDKIKGIIRKEVNEIKETYDDKRKTMIEEGNDEDLDIEDLIKPEDVVVTVSQAGYLKRIPIDTYKAQRRGGKGIIAAETKEDDIISDLFIANTRSFVLIFTNLGKIHWLKVYKIPEGSRYSKGKAVVNLVRLEENEKINEIIPIKEFDEKSFLLMTTKNGVVKKTQTSEYSRPRAGGIIAINLDDDDNLVSVNHVNEDEQVMVGTKLGMAVKFKVSDLRSVGRNARGVRGINLREKDEVIGVLKGRDDESIITITENGFGKRSKIGDYRLVRRGGVGVINIQCSERNSSVTSVMNVTDEDGILLISKKGIIIRTNAKDLSVIGRNTQGVRLMRLDKDDKVVSAAKIINIEETPINIEPTTTPSNEL